MFVERYAHALNSSDLQDDEHHTATHPLAAAALADQTGGEVLGSMLTRVKYAHGTKQAFESGTGELARLVKVWTAAVRKRGIERKWVNPLPNTEWDMNAMLTRFERVAEQSLAFWLGGNCAMCNGAGVDLNRRTCTTCAGAGKAKINGSDMIAERTRDMVSELEGIFQAHGARAAARMRREA